MSVVSDLLKKEIKRQKETLGMIPSENYTSREVLKALGSFFTNKYSEGYPGKRYYAGNIIVDEVEKLAQNLANKLFGTVYANVQPYSGSPANFAVNWALAGKGGTIMGLDLPSGGHLTHGAKVSASGVFFKSIPYHVDKNGRVDFKEVESLANKHKPKLIWVGGTAYAYKLEFNKFAKIAKKVGAYLVADISHIAGLVIGGVHPDPVPLVDIISTTTHKTLRGPRGAIILITPKGLKKDPELTKKIDATVFPGLQGGPHDNQIAALVVALEEAGKPDFKKYALQVVKNAQALAKELKELGVKLVGGGTENHLLLVDLRDYGFGIGYQAHIALEAAGIVVNKNSIPGEPASAFYPSGIRLGTPALTSRGMKEGEMKRIAWWIAQVLEGVKGHDLPKSNEKRARFIKEYKELVNRNLTLKKIRREVANFAKKYPLPGA